MNAQPTLREAWPVWLKVGLLGFGGPAGQIALLHREVVERRRWVDEDRFQHALGFCMLLPGPEAQQLATYLGWLMHGTRGGVAAGLLFILPGLVAMLGLSAAYVQFGHVPVAQAALLGVKAAVVAIVLDALARIGRRNLRTLPALAVGVVAFAAMTLARAPFPIVILAAGALGALLAPPVTAPSAPPAPAARTGRTVLLWLAVWLVPLLALAAVLGPGSVAAGMALFFGQLAVVSFGGAYAAMAYTAQAAVEGFHWVSAAQMLDGVGLAETTPGPLVLTFVFVAFVGAFQGADGGSAWLIATIAGLATAWAVFAPSFLWIFAGAPHIERLRGSRRLSGALGFVSAAVTGVIATLGFWFARHLLWAETGLRLDAVVLVALALVLVFVFKRGVLTVVGVLALAGLLSQGLHLA